MNEWLESAVNVTFETGLRRRYRDLPGLGRGGANHRLYRGSGGHLDDPRSLEDNRLNLRLPSHYPKAGLGLRRERSPADTIVLVQLRRLCHTAGHRLAGRLKWRGYGAGG